MSVRRTLLATTVVLVVLVVLVGGAAGLGAGALALEHQAATRLDTAVSKPLSRLLPDGRVSDVDVTDSPALLAERRGRLQQAVLHGRSGDHDVLTIVRGYDRSRTTRGPSRGRSPGSPSPRGGRTSGRPAARTPTGRAPPSTATPTRSPRPLTPRVPTGRALPRCSCGPAP